MKWTPVDLGTIAGILDDLAVPPQSAPPDSRLTGALRLDMLVNARRCR